MVHVYARPSNGQCHQQILQQFKDLLMLQERDFGRVREWPRGRRQAWVAGAFLIGSAIGIAGLIPSSGFIAVYAAMAVMVGLISLWSP